MAKKVTTNAAVKTNSKLSKKEVTKAVKSTSKKVAEVVRVKLTSEQFKQLADQAEAVMGMVVESEIGTKVSGTNAKQALGQGQLRVRGEDGNWQVTASNQLKGAYQAFDGPNSANVTAATFGSDAPITETFTRNGIMRIYAMSTRKLCKNPADQQLVDAIWGAIANRYPDAVNAAPKATRQPRGDKKAVENPNPLFA